MPNFTLTPIHPRGNGRAYAHASGNYQASYSTVAYTDHIPLPCCSLGLLPNHTDQNALCFNAYGQPKADVFGYETPPQFPCRAQPIDMTAARATVGPSADPNNLTNQLSTILCESFSIEPRAEDACTKNHTPITMTISLTLEAIESLSFLSLVGRMIKPH
jgi:hypothetical protein